MMSAAATLSSRARLAGLLPWACDSTTVNRWRLMAVPSILGVDLALDQRLGLLPVVGQEAVVLLRAHQAVGLAIFHLEEPAGPVAVHVDARRVVEQRGVEGHDSAGRRGEQ